MGANGSTPRLKRKNSPGDVSDSGSRKSRSSDGSFKTPPALLKESGKEMTRDDSNAEGKPKNEPKTRDSVIEDNKARCSLKDESKAKEKKSGSAKERRNMFGKKLTSAAPMANIDSDSEEGAQSYLELADEIEFHTPPPIRKVLSTYKEVKEINKGLELLNDVNRDTKDSKMYLDSKDFKTPSVLQVDKGLSLDNSLTRFARDKISMLEATKTEQEIVINKLQTEVVKLKEKVRHLCKLRQDLLEQRSQVEDRMRSVQREREQEINQRDSKIRELEDELEQYECKMEYLEHTQVHLQRSLLASENKTPKLLEELQKISQDLAECRDELKEKNHRIHELANSVMTKEAMIERLQADLKAFKKEAAAEMEKRFLTYTEEKERLMSQLQEETEEYVKAAFAEKDCQLKELNEEWQVRYDQLNDEMASLRKELEEAIAEKNDLLLSREDSSSSDDEQSVSDASESTSSDSELDWQVQERIERFREELTRIHDINTIEQRTKYENQLSEVRDKLEQKIMILKKQHEEELREFDQLLNDELNRVHKKYQTEIRRLRDQKSGSRELDDPAGRRKSDKGVQAFVGHGVERFGNSAGAPEELEAMKMRLTEVQDELRQKQDETAKLRTEASNQIRNVELYWQERLTKEMKELCYIKEREIESLRDEFNKQVKHLTDKINSLQTIMKLTGQDQPVVTPVVEEPSTSDERDEEDVEIDEDTDEDVESIEEVEGGQSEEEFEEIIEEIIELSPCAQRAAALKHNPLMKSPSASLEASSTLSSFPRSLLKKSSSSGDCRPHNRGKRVSFAEDRGDLPMMLRYNPNVSCMEILRPLEEQFTSKKKRSSIIRQSMERSQTKEDHMESEQTQF